MQFNNKLFNKSNPVLRQPNRRKCNNPTQRSQRAIITQQNKPASSPKQMHKQNSTDTNIPCHKFKHATTYTNPTSANNQAADGPAHNLAETLIQHLPSQHILPNNYKLSHIASAPPKTTHAEQYQHNQQNAQSPNLRKLCKLTTQRNLHPKQTQACNLLQPQNLLDPPKLTNCKNLQSTNSYKTLPEAVPKTSCTKENHQVQTQRTYRSRTLNQLHLCNYHKPIVPTFIPTHHPLSTLQTRQPKIGSYTACKRYNELLIQARISVSCNPPVGMPPDQPTSYAERTTPKAITSAIHPQNNHPNVIGPEKPTSNANSRSHHEYTATQRPSSCSHKPTQHYQKPQASSQNYLNKCISAHNRQNPTTYSTTSGVQSPIYHGTLLHQQNTHHTTRNIALEKSTLNAKTQPPDARHKPTQAHQKTQIGVKIALTKALVPPNPNHLQPAKIQPHTTLTLSHKPPTYHGTHHTDKIPTTLLATHLYRSYLNVKTPVQRLPEQNHYLHIQNRARAKAPKHAANYKPNQAKSMYTSLKPNRSIPTSPPVNTNTTMGPQQPSDHQSAGTTRTEIAENPSRPTKQPNPSNPARKPYSRGKIPHPQLKSQLYRKPSSMSHHRQTQGRSPPAHPQNHASTKPQAPQTANQTQMKTSTHQIYTNGNFGRKHKHTRPQPPKLTLRHCKLTIHPTQHSEPIKSKPNCRIEPITRKNYQSNPQSQVIQKNQYGQTTSPRHKTIKRTTTRNLASSNHYVQQYVLVTLPMTRAIKLHISANPNRKVQTLHNASSKSHYAQPLNEANNPTSHMPPRKTVITSQPCRNPEVLRTTHSTKQNSAIINKRHVRLVNTATSNNYHNTNPRSKPIRKATTQRYKSKASKLAIHHMAPRTHRTGNNSPVHNSVMGNNVHLRTIMPKGKHPTHNTKPKYQSASVNFKPKHPTFHNMPNTSRNQMHPKEAPTIMHQPINPQQP
eukprot:gene3137-2119_t